MLISVSSRFARGGALVLLSVLVAVDVLTPPAAAQDGFSDGAVRIGLMADMASLYSDTAGPGAVLAAKMAIEDMGGAVLGSAIEFVSLDHQNKADIAATKAREWYQSGGMDLVVVVSTSSAAMAVQEVARQEERIVLYTGVGTSALTGEACSPVGVQWAFDTYSQSVGTAATLVEQGGKSWFFIAADYAYGISLVEDATRVVEAMGGEVLGALYHPFPTTDFSSYLLQAQASGAQVIGLGNAGQDTITAIKQAKEFGLMEAGQQIAALLFFVTDVHALGLETAQGVILTTPFYWDYNEATRAWSQRFFDQMNKMPTLVQASTYSAVRHYLRAVEAAVTDAAMPVRAKMSELPVDDFFALNGHVRVDGREVNDMLLARVKSPEQSHGPWDYYEILKVIPGEAAFRPLEGSACPLVKGSAGAPTEPDGAP